jgi:hypothetical protein
MRIVVHDYSGHPFQVQLLDDVDHPNGSLGRQSEGALSRAFV